MGFSGDGACGIRSRGLRLAKLSAALRAEPGQAGITPRAGVLPSASRGLPGAAGAFRRPRAGCRRDGRVASSRNSPRSRRCDGRPSVSEAGLIARSSSTQHSISRLPTSRPRRRLSSCRARSSRFGRGRPARSIHAIEGERDGVVTRHPMPFLQQRLKLCIRDTFGRRGECCLKPFAFFSIERPSSLDNNALRRTCQASRTAKSMPGGEHPRRQGARTGL
jgi:hypothetical protein